MEHTIAQDIDYIQIKHQFECTGNSNLFTTSGSSDGNKSLTYPIGLITADEVAFAGGVFGANNKSYYLCTNSTYWTMSPYWYYYTAASAFYVNSTGDLNANYVYWVVPGVRPVINLKADVQISSGNGTSASPYIVE